MTIYGWVQFGGGYYSRITNTQYILYTENNVKIYDFTSPAEHSNGNQTQIQQKACIQRKPKESFKSEEIQRK